MEIMLSVLEPVDPVQITLLHIEYSVHFEIVQLQRLRLVRHVVVLLSCHQIFLWLIECFVMFFMYLRFYWHLLHVIRISFIQRRRQSL